MNIITGLPTFNMVKIKTYAPFILLLLLLLTDISLMALVFPGKIFGLLDMKDRIDVLSTETKQLQIADEQLVAVDESQLSSTLRIAGIALPDEKKVAGLISGLGGVASDSGVLVKSIGFSPGRVSTMSAGVQTIGAGEVEVGDKVRAIPATMTVSSSLSQFLDYLKKLQLASQLLGVTGINYSLTGSSPGGDVSLLVYYLPGRLGKPSWLYVPAIATEDLQVLSNLSPSDIFNLPLRSR